MRFICSLLCYAYAIIFCIIALFLQCFLILFRAKKTADYIGVIFLKSIIGFVTLVYGIKYTIIGLENIPKDINYIALINHQTSWEACFFRILLYPSSSILKKSLLWIPAFGLFMIFSLPIVIDRSKKISALKSLLKQGKKRLSAGRNIILYPEGTRSTPPKMGHFHKSGAILAAQNSVPILPISHNAGYCVTKNFFIKKFGGTITIIISPPIDSTAHSVTELHQLAVEKIKANAQLLQPKV